MTLSVRVSSPLAEAIEARCEQLSNDGFMASLSAGDSSLWGPEAAAEASIRLGWTSPPSRWTSLASDIANLRSELLAAGIDRVILCGMGGSSLGPEVMAAAEALPLTVIDSTHPDEVAPHLGEDLRHTVIVISSKSGGTVETDSQKRAFEEALVDAGCDPQRHIVVVTDPGSPLDQESRAAGYRVFAGDPTIGGRFSALSPFGLVPIGLAGVNLGVLLERATSGYEACSASGADNPALRLGVAIAHGHPQVNKLLYRPDPALPGFGNWVEQLVAESSGKEGKGLLPIVDSSLEGLDDALSIGPVGSGSTIEISGTLAEHIVVWEYAISVACAVLGVNPFDQPNVESAKVAARKLLNADTPEPRLESRLLGCNVFAEPPLPALDTFADLAGVLGSLAGTRGYIALCVFGPRADSEQWRHYARALEHETGRPVTLGFGPRFLHSTGQLHKGGAPEGVFLQVIVEPEHALDIPGREFDFWQLLRAQAHGDARVLIDTGQPVISITGSASDVMSLRSSLEA